jgi:thiamine-monophosphate kinase
MRSEFDFIHHIKDKYALKYIGDDCAVLPKDDKSDMVITADMLVEDIDFRLDWATPALLGYKALAVSLSDIAAMGANPKWAMLSIGVPERLWKDSFLDGFYTGWHELARQFGVELVGGDVSRSANKFIVDSVVGGEVPQGKAVLRSGAKVGDALYVTGWLGGARGGLEILEKPDSSRSDDSRAAILIKRQLEPTPLLKKAQSLRATGSIHAMIDTSDGFLSDLKHICNASSVGARFFAERIPVDYCLKDFFDESTAFEFAMNGGEDFELIFAANQERIYAPKWDEISCVGEITPKAGVIELVRDDRSEIIEPKGYRHF